MVLELWNAVAEKKYSSGEVAVMNLREGNLGHVLGKGFM